MLTDSGNAVMLHRFKVLSSFTEIRKLNIHTEFSDKQAEGCCEDKQVNLCVHSQGFFLNFILPIFKESGEKSSMIFFFSKNI